MSSFSSARKNASDNNDASANYHEEAVDVVCCGCRPNSKRRFRRILTTRTRKYHDSSQGALDLGIALALSTEKINATAVENGDEDDELFFFDACEHPLAEDEYPYISITDYVRPKRRVSMKDPLSMLGKHEGEGLSKSKQLTDDHVAILDTGTDDDDESAIQRSTLKYLSEPIQNHKSPSQRFLTLTSRSTIEQQTFLQQPRVRISQRGFPGDLTVDELGECQKFLAGLAKLDPAVSEQVYSFRDIEEEPYTICRWLRATKFEASAILSRLEDNQARFEAARDKDFFPDVSQAMGAPFSVFLSQFPFLPVGRGKNGCPVNYFQAGRINQEGILSLTTPERLEGYFWWSFMWKFKEEIRKAQDRDSNFVRVEGINIIDLYGLSSDALSSETIDIIKLSSKISDFFPETLHCMLIINAPSFFSMFWGLLKKFIDPRTAQRIQVFSNSAKGLAALRKLVDEHEIPVDYGGTNKSLKQAFVDEASDPLLRRQEIELVYVKRRGRAALSKDIVLNSDESIFIRVYTRSWSGANVTVRAGSKVCAEAQARCLWRNENAGPTDSADVPMPHCTVVAEKIPGPGTVTIQLDDLDDAVSDKKLSRGYFLVVCDIRINE